MRSLKHCGRLSANGRRRSKFATTRSPQERPARAAPEHSIGNGTSPPKPRKEKAPEPAKESSALLHQADSSYLWPNGAQAQSRNGCEPFGIASGWNLKIKRYGEGQRFTRILNDTLRDPRLVGLAFKVLCYALSKPKGWQINILALRRELGCGKWALQAAMKELEEIGYARLYREAHARWHWQIRESSDVAWPLDGSVGKIEHYQEGQFFTPILTATLLDKSLGGTALKIVCDTLSRPTTRQLWLWELRKRWRLSEYAIAKAMRQAVNAGYTLRIPSLAGGSCYRIREAPKLAFLPATPATLRKSDPEKTALHKNNRAFKNNKGQGPSAEVCSHQRKGAKQPNGEQPSHSACVFFRPKRPYPLSAGEGYATLEALGIDSEPDYDGQFFENMIANDWIIPGTGRPVYDWVATYVARLDVTMPGGYCANGAQP